MTIEPFGDGAFLVVLGDAIDERLSLRSHGLARAIRRARSDGDRTWGEPLAAYASVLVPFDPRVVDPVAARAALEALVAAALDAAPDEQAPGRLHTIPVRYGGADGPDLGEVAERTGLDPAAVVALHASTDYLVHLLGFAPGFGYLGPLPAQLVVPRRSEPRPRVPAGSVAIAGRQTAVYPFATPGGWSLIGRTAATLWDLAVDPPVTLRPGDRVRFVPFAD